jgi:flagellar biosynthesis protein FlhF
VKIRRFVAKDMRTALLQIKAELGVDAVIMSNKKIPEGVELMAAVDYSQTVPQAKSSTLQAGSVEDGAEESELTADLVSLSNTATNDDGVSSASEHAPVDSLSALLNRKVQHPSQMASTTTASQAAPVAKNVSDISEQLKSFTDRLQHGKLPKQVVSQKAADETDEFYAQTTVPTNVNDSQSVTNARVNEHRQDSQQQLNQLKNEMASIRQLLEHQVSGLMWQDLAQKDPKRAMLVDRLTHLGLTEQIADQLASYIPDHYSETEAWQAVQELMAQQIRTTNNDIVHRGGVVALVGPTGVGKTTTIAKLAARFAQIHGADSIALISTDTFRIAGFEQLATYGRIIGCQVKLAQDSEALAQLLQQFKQKKLILIDTAGMGQRDLRLVEHLATLIANSRVRIRNYLVLAANTQQRVMQENVERFKKIPLAGCIYTKLDESLSVGEIIATSIQNGLPIGYLTDGQRVPEDIKVANAKKLVMLANKMSSTMTHTQVKTWRTNNSTPIASAV